MSKRSCIAILERFLHYESYRQEMPVIDKRLLSYSYYSVCPRCDTSLERDYVSFCDRCGQHLEWSSYDSACTLDF